MSDRPPAGNPSAQSSRQSLAERRTATAGAPRRAVCCRPSADAGAAEAASSTGCTDTCSTAARANAAAERIRRNPGCAARRSDAASASSAGAISGGPAPFCGGDRRPGNSRRRVPQRRGHRVGAIILRTRRRRGRQRCGAAAGCDIRSQLSRSCRCPRQPRRPCSGRSPGIVEPATSAMPPPRNASKTSNDSRAELPRSGCRGLAHEEGFDFPTHRIGVGAEKVDEDHRHDERAGGADQRRVIGSRKIVDEAAEKPAGAGA